MRIVITATFLLGSHRPSQLEIDGYFYFSHGQFTYTGELSGCLSAAKFGDGKSATINSTVYAGIRILLQRTSDMQKNVNKLIDLVVAVAYQFLGVCTIPIGYCNNYIHCE